jgi:hypothetical protein
MVINLLLAPFLKLFNQNQTKSNHFHIDAELFFGRRLYASWNYSIRTKQQAAGLFKKECQLWC